MAAPDSLSAMSEVTADDALRRLQEGNARYVKGESMHAHNDPARRDALVSGQAPYACILGCADSRVPPELVFDAGLGDVFVIRVAGNIFSDEISGSIEYAVEHLGVQLVVVLGHQSCGAVGATLQGMEAPGDIKVLVEAIKPAVEEAKGLDGDTLEHAVRLNARNVARELLRDEPVLAAARRAGKMRVLPAYYRLDDGSVEFADEPSID